MVRAFQRHFRHFLIYYGVREEPPGWQAGRFFPAFVIAIYALLVYGLTAEAYRVRGPAVAALVFVGVGWLAIGVVQRRGGKLGRTAIEHPYRDAAYSIPIGLLSSLVLLPSWSLAACVALTAAYAALIYGLAWRGVRRRRQAGEPRAVR